MLQTQAANNETLPPLDGSVWDEGPKWNQVAKFGSREGTRSRAAIRDLSLVHPQAIIASSEELGWYNIRVLQVYHGYAEMDVPPLEHHCVIVPLESSLHLSASIGGHDFERSLSTGDIAIIPAGMASHWRCHNSIPGDALHIYLHPQFVQKTAEMSELNHGPVVIEPALGIRDDQLSHIAMSLLCELKEENVVGRLYANSVASLLAMQLVRRYSYFKNVHIRKGGMAPHKLRSAIRLINDNLDRAEKIALATVAENIGVSLYHFSRGFKKSMGLSPIKYIGQQRIERAKKLLTETDHPIADIALRAGFSDQSHFTSLFRRLVGVTPGCFRRGI
jgi:AraC family transcriptional regulator